MAEISQKPEALTSPTGAGTTTEPFRAAPLKIRDLEFFPPVLPAPMCGISDYAWRRLSREQGCPLVFTQMVSSEAMIRGVDKCWRLLDMERHEDPICAQLFGAEPESLADSARMLQDAGATIVDLNMGCPVNKIVNSRGGSALMKEPDLVRKIFKAMRAALDVPFTVKFRAGFDKYGDEALLISRIAEEEGLDAICIHGRTRQQQFKGKADWTVLKVIKETMSIPVIGNGDVCSGDDAERMMRETGVDGVMIGRGGMGNPWLFGEVCARLSGREQPDAPTIEERLDTVAQHARIMVERKGDHGLTEFRKHAVQYLRGFHEAKILKSKLLQTTNIDDYVREIELAKKSILDWRQENQLEDQPESAVTDSPVS